MGSDLTGLPPVCELMNLWRVRHNFSSKFDRARLPAFQRLVFMFIGRTQFLSELHTYDEPQRAFTTEALW
jgi:hypothetical protein